LGYTLLNRSVHFGGTLQQIDRSQWHDLLAEAAIRKPDPVKKDAAAKTGENQSAEK